MPPSVPALLKHVWSWTMCVAQVFCSSTQCACFGESLAPPGEIVLFGQSIQLGVQHQFECSLWEVEDICFPGYVWRLNLQDTRIFSLHHKVLEVVFPLYLEGFVYKFLCSFLQAFHASCEASFLLYMRYYRFSRYYGRYVSRPLTFCIGFAMQGILSSISEDSEHWPCHSDLAM